MSEKAMKNSGAQKKTSSGFVKEIIYLAGTLLLLTAIVAGLLGYIDGITRGKILENSIRKTNEAMATLIPGAQFEEKQGLVDGTDVVRGLFEARQNGELVGVCVQAAPTGFGGEISMVVAVGRDGAVLGVQITRMTETAGLGSKASDPDWLNQFYGLDGGLSVVKGTAVNNGEIVALSSATITSVAVTNGVQQALDFARHYMEVE